MATSKDICRAIQDVDQKLGKCGADYDVYLDRKNEAWVIDIHDERYHLRTFLDKEDADSCIDEKKCLGLGFQTGQLRYNFQKYLTEHALESK